MSNMPTFFATCALALVATVAVTHALRTYNARAEITALVQRQYPGVRGDRDNVASFFLQHATVASTSVPIVLLQGRCYNGRCY
jgi:hypothetical protein